MSRFALSSLKSQKLQGSMHPAHGMMDKSYRLE
ncbi:hypothetical protein COCCU_03585 [Corynebacterium occultum]|uniref:Uncharacterized protein n=1 Tax=Corynebacterium occultum TaxID=2675219 RepID=A0A6B8VU87_9CORY|nr:hypothetical protein COCCU_03585 [Corynebacterium occultum]